MHPPKRPRTAATLAACAVYLFTLPAHALDPIDTDGPDYVESTETVAKGHAQYEIDFTAVDDRRAATHGTDLSTPALLKYGFADNFELRLTPAGYMREDGVSGVGETGVGLKWHAQDKDAEHGKPPISLIMQLDAPSGSSQFKGNGLRPSLRAVIAWDLPYDLTLGIMPGVGYETTPDAHRYVSPNFGMVLNKHFSEIFRAFVEYSAPQIAPGRDGGVVADWDVGAAYMLTRDLQLGVRAGVAANRNTPSRFALFEVAQRF